VIVRVDHLGIAVRKIDERLGFWRDALGLRMTGRERVASEGVEVAFLPAGDTRIELLEPVTPDSAVARHLDKRGEGLHHVTLQVVDLDACLARLADRGVEVVGGASRTGAGGHRIAFVHPRASGGVLVELVERDAEAGPPDIEPGRPVLAYLGDPGEKLWGVLRRLDASGIVLHGLDLGSFDAWTSQVERGEDSGGPSTLFVPMRRLEKLLLDLPSGDLPSLADRFRARTGRRVQDVLG
jgi:methylmalonyl-CoA/ethylmalonyl-CoA epimerase